MLIPKLSVAIISYNEERNIARTLAALDGLPDEIIVVDSFSEDATAEIAKSFGASIFSEEWKGHIAQKNSALGKCKGEWILCLDSDEEITPELKSEIAQYINSDNNAPAVINRRTVYLRKIMRRAWQPDYKLRLVRNDSRPEWTGYNPHDVLSAQGKPIKLKGEILHYSYRDILDHWQKTIFYARSTAESYAALGKSATLFNIIANPLFSFVKNYIVHGWFIDGIPGLIAGTSAFLYVFLKYIFLWEIYRKRKY
ncbi:glycosyltransferase family 2 protein [Ignavibacteria bacterium]|jgi:glycosyltransferase involved in cell wall biosynthesis|nr:glycosyltransferase family 2 protein [Bacteroidota bacterium]MCZ2133421.1 glycosyltransferase family 2 protein [Bacteroidota bacterium]